MKARQDWKVEQRKARRAVRRLYNRGLAVPMLQASSFALMAEIHSEPSVQVEIESIERAIDLLDNTFRNQETQGYVADLTKYGKHIYTARPCAMLGDLASENETAFAFVAKGMDKAENEARSN